MRLNLENLGRAIEDLRARVSKLEVEETRETREGTIRPGTKRGPKTK